MQPRPGLAVTAAAMLLAGCDRPEPVPSARAQGIAEHAVEAYFDSTVATLADLVAFRTVEREGLKNAENPEFRAMTEYLRRKAGALGLDFADHGAVVVVGLGDAPDRLGIVTHGDVQPADPAKWARDPFTLDTLSEPGRLLGRGTQDDKGPIATALYAMKAVRDSGSPLDRRIELMISYTEESDWDPFREFLSRRDPPDLNVAIDADYPVVIAEKGWGAIYLALPAGSAAANGDARMPRLIEISGGVFLSQIPEDASAVIAGATAALEEALRAAARTDTAVSFAFHRAGDSLTVRAHGRSAHSSTPREGRNAITHLAALLGHREWPDTPAARVLSLINDLVGTGHYARKFGDLAHSHPFMGRLTLSLTTLEAREDSLVAGVNIRRPVGRDSIAIEREIRETVEAWKTRAGVDELRITTRIANPHYIQDAPHVPVLLDIFRHYTGQEDAQPISIGGATHARLVPNGVVFGPAMPGEPYTGHSEHEFLTREDFRLNLRMYTAMLAELAGR